MDINVETDCPRDSYCSKISVSGGGGVGGVGCGSFAEPFGESCSSIGAKCKKMSEFGIETEICCCNQDL